MVAASMSYQCRVPRPGTGRRLTTDGVLRGGEAVAGVQEPGQDDLEGGHGLGAVAAAVVLEDDRAGPGVAHDVADDGGHAGAGPVAGIDGPVERGHPGLRTVLEA